MPTFDYSFTVNAPLSAVADFHSHTDILKRLTPPPLIVQIHTFGNMQEGMIADFTLWFGFFPVRWRAEHVAVSPTGFTDVQTIGPLAAWAHTHSFEALSEHKTTVREHIEYRYRPGWRGMLSRLVFAKPTLFGLFQYRKWVTRRSLRRLKEG